MVKMNKQNMKRILIILLCVFIIVPLMLMVLNHNTSSISEPFSDMIKSENNQILALDMSGIGYGDSSNGVPGDVVYCIGGDISCNSKEQVSNIDGLYRCPEASNITDIKCMSNIIDPVDDTSDDINPYHTINYSKSAQPIKILSVGNNSKFTKVFNNAYIDGSVNSLNVPLMFTDDGKVKFHNIGSDNFMELQTGSEDNAVTINACPFFFGYDFCNQTETNKPCVANYGDAQGDQLGGDNGFYNEDYYGQEYRCNSGEECVGYDCKTQTFGRCQSVSEE